MMDLEPLVASYDQADLTTPSAKAKERGLKRGHEKALKDAGVPTASIVSDYTIAFNGFAAAMSYEDAQAVARQDGVLRVMPNELRQLQTDNSPSFLGLTGPAGAWSTGYTGEDVVVGVIDTGIWPEHPSFADDGSYTELADYAGLPCEFGDTDYNPADAPFECNDKLLGARDMRFAYEFFIGSEVYSTARDYDGHGTHTASTAAGNVGVQASILGGDLGTVSGIAPRARVVAYSACGELGCFTSDLVGAIDQAVADGVHVINYSIGGGASLAGADDIAFLFAATANVWVATSNGNSGPGPYTVGGPASVPWITSVGASTQNRTFQGSASSSDGWEFFGASVTGGTEELPLVDAEDAGDELCAVGALDPSIVDGKIVLCKRGAYARVAKSQAVMEAGGAGMILYNGSDADTENTDNHYVPSVHINNTDGLAIKGYIDSAGAAAIAQINGGTYTPIDAPSMAAFSSRGPNPVAEDIIKPDITAPGVDILAGNTPTPVLGAPGQLFQAIGGTSMSSPHVAGVFALLRQAHPDWTAAMAKSAIMTTAYQDVMKEDGATPADPFDMGAGHLNPGNAVAKGSAFQPGLVYNAGLFEYAAFTCGADLGVFTPGSCAFLESIGVPFDASDLNLPSIGIAEVAGSQTVVRTVTSVAEDIGWRTYTVTVDAPEGYEVVVSPSTIRLKRGMSTSYEVTVTNSSAPAGEWRFGSLTWTESNKHYAVSSPIAVKGSLFSAPAAANGTGEDGSASFDVTFGYTGSYSAAPHGLVAATETSGSVDQDPDQTFDPADTEGTTAHAFALSGSAFFRLTLTYPDSNIDLDVFMLDSSGHEIASSTNGGTDELIELLLPADDTYTVYVHGWQTTGLTIDYTLETWDVSATPGGSLVIDSAPASATAGATETISLSWSGLAAGSHYLGAVSHTGDSGLMGLTLVEVDTN
jgi:subtilisin family serine protease